MKNIAFKLSFEEHPLKVRTKQDNHPIARLKYKHNIVVVMKIKHLKAALQMREDFLDKHHQATRIQAVFRSSQIRRRYCKIIWSIKILEIAILRWLLKIKGFRELEVQRYAATRDEHLESDVEEDFFQARRKQAEAHVERCILRFQAMFRSMKVQEDYRRFGG